MKIKKLNRTHNVFNRGAAKWAATFQTNAGYSLAILKMAQAFGMGLPYTNSLADFGQPWLFRNKDPSRMENSCKSHVIYLTKEEQVTFCSMAFAADD